MIRHFLTVTLRSFGRQRILTGINLVGLSVGLTCILGILIWMHDELSYDQFHTHKHQLYRVMENLTFSDGTITTQNATPGILAATLKEEIPEIVYSSSMDSWTNSLLSYEDRSMKEVGRYVSTDFLTMFSFPLIAGDYERALSEPNSIVITKSVAEKLFPGVNAMGKTLKLANWSDYKITGILEDLPSNSIFDFQFLLPFQQFLERNTWAQQWNNNGLECWVMLDNDADVDAVNAKIRTFVSSRSEQDNVDLFLQPLTDAYLRTDFEDGVYQGGGRIQYVRLFGLIAFLVLIMACVNFMNLSTARASIRAREVGVRKVVGASRKQLTVQFLGEAILLSTLSAGIAVITLTALMPAFNLLTGKDLALNLIDSGLWWKLGLIIIGTGLLGGSYPAWIIPAFRPVNVLKGKLAQSPRGGGLRKSLVTLQFSIAAFLIIAVLIIQRQLDYLQNKNLGYERDHLVLVPMSYELQQKFDLVKRDIGAINGVQSVSASHSKITGYTNATDNIVWEGKAPDDNRMFIYETVSPDYVTTIGAELVEGRDFSTGFQSDSANFILNETAAKAMGFEPPYTGRHLKAWGNDGTIVGVVKDFNFSSLRDPLAPLVLMMSNPYVWTLYARINGDAVQSTLREMERVCKTYSKAYPFEYQFADAAYHSLYEGERVVSRLAGVAAFLAILISCLGLFGLAMFTAERRMKEIGIRKVLGAGVSGIVQLLSRDFLGPVCVALIVAIPVAWYFLRQWLENFAYRIPLDWWLFAVAALLALGIAFLTISYQSLKAATANPMKSLRSE